MANSTLINELLKEKEQMENELELLQNKELFVRGRIAAIQTLLNTPGAEESKKETFDFPYSANMIWTDKCYSAVCCLQTAYNSDVIDFIIGMEPNKVAKEIEGNVSQAMNKLKTEGYIQAIGKSGKKFIYAIVPGKYDEMKMAQDI